MRILIQTPVISTGFKLCLPTKTRRKMATLGCQSAVKQLELYCFCLIKVRNYPSYEFLDTAVAALPSNHGKQRGLYVSFGILRKFMDAGWFRKKMEHLQAGNITRSKMAPGLSNYSNSVNKILNPQKPYRGIRETETFEQALRGAFVFLAALGSLNNFTLGARSAACTKFAWTTQPCLVHGALPGHKRYQEENP